MVPIPGSYGYMYFLIYAKIIYSHNKKSESYSTQVNFIFFIINLFFLGESDLFLKNLYYICPLKGQENAGSRILLEWQTQDPLFK